MEAQNPTRLKKIQIYQFKYTPLFKSNMVCKKNIACKKIHPYDFVPGKLNFKNTVNLPIYDQVGIVCGDGQFVLIQILTQKYPMENFFPINNFMVIML